MSAYVIRRVLIGVALLLAMTLVTFLLFFATPVDYARQACGKNCTQDQIAQTEKALGYDQPLYQQWGAFMKGFVVGRDYPADEDLRQAAPQIVTHCAAPCLGYSKVNEVTVNSLIVDSLPITLSLAALAMVLWLVGGVLFGILAAITKGSFLDRGVVGMTLVIYAFPSFFIAVFMLKYVSIKWGLVTYPAYVSIADGGAWQWFVNLLLPALTLALLYLAWYVRMTRAFVIESMSEDYIRTARAKGLTGRRVVFKHGLRAALTPLVTMVGLDFASLLGGAIITESVFNYNGLGLLTVQSVGAGDLPTIVGVVLVSATFVILANIVVDVLYAVLDPRVRVG